MCNKLVVIAAMLLAVAAQSAFAGGGGYDGGRYDCSGRRDGRPCDSTPTTTPAPIINNNQLSAGAAAAAAADATAKAKAEQQQKQTQTQTAEGGKVSIGDINGGSGSPYTFYNPLQVPVSPLTIMPAGNNATVLSQGKECGPRHILVPIELVRPRYFAMGFGSHKDTVPTGLSIDKGIDTVTPFIELKAKDGTVLAKYGQVITRVAASESASTSAGSALSYGNGNGRLGGVGATGTAAGVDNIVGVYADDCSVPLHPASAPTAEKTVIKKNEKQGIFYEDRTSRKALPAGTKYKVPVVGPVVETTTVNGVLTEKTVDGKPVPLK